MRFFRILEFLCGDLKTHCTQWWVAPEILFVEASIRDHLAYFDSHTVFIKVCDTPHKTDCRRNIASKFVPWNLKSIWIMPSILTCAVITLCETGWCSHNVITLCEHQPVSTVCACMAKQRSWNFCVKTSQVFVTSTCENRPYSYVVVMNVSFCDCAAQESSYTTVLDHYKIVQSSKYFIDIHQTCRYGQRYINKHQKEKQKIKLN